MTARLARWGRRVAWVTTAALACVTVASSVWGMQRSLKTKPRNFHNAPVVVKHAKAFLTEAFSAPTQAAGSDVGKSHVRYANRANKEPLSFELQGEMICVNQSSQPVEALKLAIVPLDAFQQPIRVPGQRDAYAVKQVVVSIPRGGSTRVEWEQAVDASDVYEVAVIVIGVRYADGSVWRAPDEELIDTF